MSHPQWDRTSIKNVLQQGLVLLVIVLVLFEITLWSSGHRLAITRSSRSKPDVTIISPTIEGDDVQWMYEEFPQWNHVIYQMDVSNATNTVAQNKGREAAAYLSYIITHYYDLPDFMIFIHSRRYQWHNEDPMYDHVPPLRNLQFSYVEQVGYANLRCTWDPGCPTYVAPNISHVDNLGSYSGTIARAHQTIFPDEPIPTMVAGACCAQFAVSRAKVHERPVYEYERVRQWLWTSHMADIKSGTVIEHLWPVIFGMGASHCPDTQMCFCNLYNLCDLDCPEEGKCHGRWFHPPFWQALPDEWPAKEVQHNGWPWDGWWEDEKMG